MRKLSYAVCLTCCVLSLTVTGVGRSAERGRIRSALESIDSAELRHHVDVLADDTFEGREAGSRGGRAAAGYLINLLQKHGLRGGGEDGSFLQPFGHGYRNVLAILDGSDPRLKNEFVVVCAHYDHVGYGTPRNSYGPTGYIHNGADDNASGVSGLLEIVEACTLLPENPKRSILFLFFDGEEKGLLGSKHWVRQPTLPLENVALAVNVDMIGRLRDDKLIVYGARSGEGLRRFVSEMNEPHELLLDFDWELKDNSDHYPLFSHSIPVLMLHTGLHDDYHRPRDDAHKINSEGLREVSRLLFDVVHEAADRPDRFRYRGRARRETPELRKRLESPSPPAPPRLGINWKVPDETSGNPDRPGLIVQRVVADSPAARADLRVGDRILTMDGWSIDDETEFRQRLLLADQPVRLEIRRDSNTEPVRIDVPLAGDPVRLGVTIREDESEPGTVLVTGVTPGSAADLAGVETLDRIYRISGQSFDDQDGFLELTRTLPGPIRLTIERQGRLSTVELP